MALEVIVVLSLDYEDNDLLSLYAKYHALGYWHVTHGGIYKSSSKGSLSGSGDLRTLALIPPGQGKCDEAGRMSRPM